MEASEADQPKEAPIRRVREPQPAQEVNDDPVAAKQEELRRQYPGGLKYQLAPFDPQHGDDTGGHLRVEDIDGDDDMKQKAQFFICPICSMIALDPRECAKCDSIYCNACI